MKKILEFSQILNEAEIAYQLKQGQTRNQRNEHPIFSEFESLIAKKITPHSSAKQISFGKTSSLEAREIYTLKKAILNNISQAIFNKDQMDFFSHNFFIKLTKNSNHELSHFLRSNQIAYIFFDTQIVGPLKFTKNSFVLDDISGQFSQLHSLYQNLEKKTYPCIIDSIPYNVEMPLSYGLVVLTK